MYMYTPRMQNWTMFQKGVGLGRAADVQTN